MWHRGFLLWLLWPLALPSWANEFESTERLRTLVHSYLTEIFLEDSKGSRDEDQFSVTVSNLDSRLALASCAGNIHKNITSAKPYGSNLTVRLTCTGENRWSIFVPARVDVFADIAVMKHSLQRGDVVTENDITLVRMNTNRAGTGHIKDLSRAIGMELRRPLQSGDPVRLSHLQAPEVVKRGDKVMLEARSNGLSVVVAGTAMASGQMGDQIRVRNTKSRRIIDALVVGPGRVQAIF